MAHAFEHFVDQSCLFACQALIVDGVLRGQHVTADRQAKAQDGTDDDHQDSPGFQ